MSPLRIPFANGAKLAGKITAVRGFCQGSFEWTFTDPEVASVHPPFGND